MRLTPIETGLVTAFAISAALVVCAPKANPTTLINYRHTIPIVYVGTDNGGRVMDYAIRTIKYKNNNTNIKFSGTCYSACTLYLNIPSSRLCLYPGAQFGFHRAWGSTPEDNRIATQFLWNSYPGWVRGWINSHGGLQQEMKIMPYEYARKYIKGC